MKGIKVNFVNGTATITAAFQKNMESLDSEESKYVKALLADFPNIKLVSKTHSTPSSYKNKDGSVTKKNQFNNLTYERMESFIAALPNSEEYMEQFKSIKAAVSSMSKNGYVYVRKWFVAQFPNYKSDPISYLYTHPKLVVPSEIIVETSSENSAA